jgi:hypothetical protein
MKTKHITITVADLIGLLRKLPEELKLPPGTWPELCASGELAAFLEKQFGRPLEEVICENQNI